MTVCFYPRYQMWNNMLQEIDHDLFWLPDARYINCLKHMFIILWMKCLNYSVWFLSYLTCIFFPSHLYHANVQTRSLTDSKKLLSSAYRTWKMLNGAPMVIFRYIQKYAHLHFSFIWYFLQISIHHVIQPYLHLHPELNIPPTYIVHWFQSPVQRWCIMQCYSAHLGILTIETRVHWYGRKCSRNSLI